jgi:hypothetical protein
VDDDDEEGSTYSVFGGEIVVDNEETLLELTAYCAEEVVDGNSDPRGGKDAVEDANVGSVAKFVDEETLMNSVVDPMLKLLVEAVDMVDIVANPLLLPNEAALDVVADSTADEVVDPNVSPTDGVASVAVQKNCLCDPLLDSPVSSLTDPVNSLFFALTLRLFRRYFLDGFAEASFFDTSCERERSSTPPSLAALMVVTDEEAKIKASTMARGCLERVTMLLLFGRGMRVEGGSTPA